MGLRMFLLCQLTSVCKVSSILSPKRFLPDVLIAGVGGSIGVFMEEIQVQKYQKEIESVLPLCKYDKIKTKYLNKGTLIGKKLLLIKKEQHKKYTQPYFVLWIGIVAQEGLQTTDNAGKSIAITLAYSQQHIDFYNSIQAGDVFVISQYEVNNMKGYSYKVVNYGSRRNAGSIKGV